MSLKKCICLVSGVFVASLVMLILFGISWPNWIVPLLDKSQPHPNARATATLCGMRELVLEFKANEYADVWQSGSAYDSSSLADLRLTECVLDALIRDRNSLMPYHFELNFICRMDGGRVLVDSWQHPYMAIWASSEDAARMKGEAARSRIGNIIIWSCGSNGVNEWGGGDDVWYDLQHLSE